MCRSIKEAHNFSSAVSPVLYADVNDDWCGLVYHDNLSCKLNTVMPLQHYCMWDYEEGTRVTGRSTSCPLFFLRPRGNRHLWPLESRTCTILSKQKEPNPGTSINLKKLHQATRGVEKTSGIIPRHFTLQPRQWCPGQPHFTLQSASNIKGNEQSIRCPHTAPKTLVLQKHVVARMKTLSNAQVIIRQNKMLK